MISPPWLRLAQRLTYPVLTPAVGPWCDAVCLREADDTGGTTAL
ncbi:hypothetical protein [Pseudactinotalea terrae]|nr:hypothetical protein [Pseudactinotalea terrae]